MNDVGKILMVVGGVVLVLGLLLWSGVGKNWLGRLPGDFHFRRGNFGFYFPIVTCILLSILLTVVLRIFRK